jgi:hypothetical protein
MRHVSPTLDGEAYHRRCLSLIADLEDAEGAFSGVKPKGLLRIEVQGTLARISPRLRKGVVSTVRQIDHPPANRIAIASAIFWPVASW